MGCGTPHQAGMNSHTHCTRPLRVAHSAHRPPLKVTGSACSHTFLSLQMRTCTQTAEQTLHRVAAQARVGGGGSRAPARSAPPLASEHMAKSPPPPALKFRRDDADTRDPGTMQDGQPGAPAQHAQSGLGAGYQYTHTQDTRDRAGLLHGFSPGEEALETDGPRMETVFPIPESAFPEGDMLGCGPLGSFSELSDPYLL